MKTGTKYFAGMEVTEREFMIIKFVAEKRLTSQEIAERLGLSIKTIDKILSLNDPDYGLYERLGVTNRKELTQLYHQVYGENSGVTCDDLLEEYTHLFEIVDRMAFFEGKGKEAAWEAHHLAERMTRTLKKAPHFYHQDLLDRLLLVYRVEGWGSNMAAGSGDMWFEKTSFRSDLFTLTKEYNDPRFTALGDHLVGDSYFIARNFPEALKYFMQVVDIQEDLDDQAHAHRTLALIWGILGEQERCKREVETAKRIIEECLSKKLLRSIELHEGLSRSLSYAGLFDMAYDTLQEGKKQLRKINYNEETPIQLRAMLLRAEIELACLSSRYDVLTLEAAGREVASLLSKQTPRLSKSIHFLLDTCLNNSKSPTVRMLVEGCST